MKKAIIYRPTKSAMQSGLNNTKHWSLGFVQNNSKYTDSVMGWTGSHDMLQEIKLRFDSLDEATSYAKENNIEYDVIETKSKSFKPKAYADNFIN